jgi:hypothetical protein
MTRPTTTGKAQDLITFTRSTTGTYLDSVTYGNELVTNGTFDSNVDGWTVNTYGTIAYSNGTAILTNTDGVYRVRANQAIGTEVGKTYVLTYSATGNYNFLHIGSEHFNIGIGQDGPHSKTFVAVSNNTNIQIGLSTTAAGFSSAFDNISVKELTGGQGTQGTPLLRTSAINEARIEYDASGNCLGLLVEEARTNALLQSGNIGAWSGSVGTKTNVTLTENAITAPDGTQTADKVQRTVLDTSADYRQAKSVVAGNDYTFSIFAKADVQARLELDFSNSRFTSQDYVRFDVDTGTAYGSGSGATYSITNYGNGWYRFSLTATCTESGDTGVIARITNNEPHYAWGAQLETGSFPTSYIPTNGSTVTRAADVASLAVSEFGYNQDQGSVVVEAVMPPSVISEQFWILGSNTNSARWAFSNSTSPNVNAYDGASIFTVSSLQPSATQKMAIGTDQSTAIMCLDGVSGNQANTNGNISSLTTVFYFGGNWSTPVLNFNGHIKSVQYYPLRLSNAQLQALTV